MESQDATADKSGGTDQEDRIAELRVGDEVAIYDRKNHRAWMQARGIDVQEVR